MGRVFALGFGALGAAEPAEGWLLAGGFSLSVMCWGLIAQKAAGH